MTRCSTSPNGDRVPRSRSRNRYLPRLGLWHSQRIRARSRPATRAKKTRGVTPTAPETERSTGTSESSRKSASAAIPAPAVFQRVVDDQRIARKHVGRDPPQHAQPAQHRAATEDRGQERARRQREDQQDQVDLLLEPRDQEQDSHAEIDEALAGQDLPFRRPDGAEHPSGPVPEPAARLPRARFARRRSSLAILLPDAQPTDRGELAASHVGTRMRSTMSRMIASAAPNSPA